MAEIFKEAQAFDNHPDRWNHDLSHKIYGSFKCGLIYPVYTELMCPTDSIKLDIGAMLQFMPTPTPLQSNLRVIFHTFFQRLKNIHKDWQNTIEMLEQHELPYILPHVSEFVPGSIHDFLDCPCSLVYHGFTDIPLRSSFISQSQTSVMPYIVQSGSTTMPFSLYFNTENFRRTSVANGFSYLIPCDGIRSIPSSDSEDFDGLFSLSTKTYCPFVVGSNSEDTVQAAANLSVAGNWNLFVYHSSSSVFEDAIVPSNYIGLVRASGVTPYSLDDPNWRCVFSSPLVRNLVTSVDVPSDHYLFYVLGYTVPSGDALLFNPEFWSKSPVTGAVPRYRYSAVNWFTSFFVNNSYSLADFPHLIPFLTAEYPDDANKIKLRAYRHRTYESIFNCFYRNNHGNQPFRINGQIQYNKYNTTVESGVDNTHYDLMHRNWELDAYTSALPSPQQGNAPLVGVTATGRLTITDDDGTRSTAQLRDLPDGQQGLEITDINIQNDSHRSILMSLASSGFTINDLRETNALQKFLETNIRKGFRYVDFISGHFGKAPKHQELDMPEFLGGFAVKLDVGKVTNTNAVGSSSADGVVLGSFAGSAQAFGQSKHSINYYADDYGYLMVTMCIVPDTCYSQILPKDYLYSNPLDFPFPEFAHLGYQPITYEEFCPVERYKDMQLGRASGGNLQSVFGYQRPMYERIWRPDRLHGQFLTTMNNYAISRWFDGAPKLGQDFLEIKPEEVQNVFTITKADNDIAFGQIGFSVTLKTPVPRTVIPSIGR